MTKPFSEEQVSQMSGSSDLEVLTCEYLFVVGSEQRGFSRQARFTVSNKVFPWQVCFYNAGRMAIGNLVQR